MMLLKQLRYLASTEYWVTGKGNYAKDNMLSQHRSLLNIIISFFNYIIIYVIISYS